MTDKILAVLAFILTFQSCFAQSSFAEQLNELRTKIEDGTYRKIDAIIVEVKDQIVIEEYFNGFNRDKHHDTRSSFKSITSLLTGIAIDQGFVKIEDSISKYFPELKHSEKGNIIIQDLLEMRSGINCEEFYDIGPYCEDEMWESKDWIAYCLGLDLKSEPGLNWSYNSIDPMLVGEVISRATGKTIMEFAEENLFKPLGISKYEWTISPKGRGMTAGSFYIRPLDMLKITRLVSNQGNWNGQQIISKEWIEKSTSCHIDVDYSFVRYSRMPDAQYRSATYGFYWYKERIMHQDIDTEVLFASGNGGQYMMILPDYDAKVVFTGSNYNNWRGKYPFEILLKYILPMLKA